MRFSTILILASLFFSLPASTQNDILADPRDGNSYPIELIGNKWWFASNLKYETEGSHCPNTSKKDCKTGNFYPYTELLKVCPSGWHVSTKAEWDDFIKYRSTQTGINDLQINTYNSDGVYNINYTETSDTTLSLNLFESNAPLKLKQSGWVQGKRKQKMNGITLWAINPDLVDDLKFHLHIGANSYVEHTHEHHIIDKPKRVRKFAVRCVKD